MEIDGGGIMKSVRAITTEESDMGGGFVCTTIFFNSWGFPLRPV